MEVLHRQQHRLVRERHVERPAAHVVVADGEVEAVVHDETPAPLPLRPLPGSRGGDSWWGLRSGGRRARPVYSKTPLAPFLWSKTAVSQARKVS